MYWSKVCTQEFWYIVSGLYIQLGQSENNNPAHTKNSHRLWNTQTNVPFFCELTWIHGSVVKVSHSESCVTGSIPPGKRNSLPPLSHFEWHWARQSTDTSAFILLHSLHFFFHGFRQWRSRADRVLALNMKIRLPMFWSRSWAQALTRPYMLAWRMGVIIVIVEPPRKCHKSAWPMNCRKYLKTRANCKGFSTLTPRLGCCV